MKISKRESTWFTATELRAAITEAQGRDWLRPKSAQAQRLALRGVRGRHAASDYKLKAWARCPDTAFVLDMCSHLKYDHLAVGGLPDCRVCTLEHVNSPMGVPAAHDLGSECEDGD